MTPPTDSDFIQTRPSCQDFYWVDKNDSNEPNEPNGI